MYLYVYLCLELAIIKDWCYKGTLMQVSPETLVCEVGCSRCYLT